MSSTLHHRGEHGFGTVRGFEHHAEDKYVPRAMWTQTEGSVLKQPEFNVEAYCAEGRQADAQKKFMHQHVRSVLDLQMQEKAGRSSGDAAEKQELMRATGIDMSRKIREDNMEKEGVHSIKKAFRAGLDEQMGQNARRSHENRLTEAYEAAEIKMRTTQQLCAELSEGNKKKDAAKKDMQDQLAIVANRNQQQRAEKEFELSQTRHALKSQMQQDLGCWEASLTRVNAAAKQQELNYAHYANNAGKVEGERRAVEDRRLDRQEKHHQMRTDLHYAQREMARARQQHRVVQDLEHQVSQKARQRDTKVIQEDFERSQVNEATRLAMEADLMRFHNKRTEELDHQAALIAQMKDNQKRKKEDTGDLGHSRRPANLKIMDVTPGLLSISETWASGSSSQQAHPSDHTQRMDASKYLSKPGGRAEERQPWMEVDIAKSHGPGGLVGVWGGDGPTRSKLMATGGAQKSKPSLHKSLELANREKQWSGNWYDGLSPADVKAGRQAASKRKDAMVADRTTA